MSDIESSGDESVGSFDHLSVPTINEQIHQALEVQIATPMSDSDSSGSDIDSSGSESESCDFNTLRQDQKQETNQEISSTPLATLEISDVWSDTEEIKHRYVETGDKNRVRKTTFLNNKFKRKKGGPKIVGYKPARSSKFTPSLWNKYHILTALHNSKQSLAAFKRKHRGARCDWASKVREITTRSWKRYRLKCGPDSPRMKQLAQYIKSHSKIHCQSKQRFRKNPEKPWFGILPIWEQFHCLYYQLVADANETRSVKFMQTNMKHVYQNVRVMSLLKEVMSDQEWQLLKIVKFSRGYVYHVMVCLSQYIICKTETKN